MFWNDDNDKKQGFETPDDVIDVAFRVSCPTLPLEHAHALSTAILQRLPWLADEPQAAIHLIHGATSGNGWYRPEDTTNELLHLSRRTRLRLRIPKARLEDAGELIGQTLEIEGHPLEVGKSDVFLLSSLPTLFSRYVVCRAAQDEIQFLEETSGQLQTMGISSRKMLGGITHTMNFPDGPVFTRSLMVADLEPAQAISLQESGLGEGRLTGCGIFLPHKGIKPVNETEGE